jgi:hypothetical protein
MPSPLELRNKGRGRNMGRGGALAPPAGGAPAPPAGGDDSALAQAQREALNATTAATVAATNEASRTSTLLAEQTIAFAARNQERIEAQWVVQDAQAAALAALPAVGNTAIGETILPPSATNFARFPKAEL